MIWNLITKANINMKSRELMDLRWFWWRFPNLKSAIYAKPSIFTLID